LYGDVEVTNMQVGYRSVRCLSHFGFHFAHVSFFALLAKPLNLPNAQYYISLLTTVSTGNLPSSPSHSP
jgi:hypothetical protein